MASMESKSTHLIQECISNQFEQGLDELDFICGIIGDQPSKYAKSPIIWTSAFKELGINAKYLPFDVKVENLESLVGALKGTASYIGGNVTVPYKVSVMDYLDELDPLASRIGAVNTIVKDNEGRLIGYNTDAEGALASMVQKLPWNSAPFLDGLDGFNVLILGAGGAARATAFILASQKNLGRLWISNRSIEKGKDLVAAISEIHPESDFIEINQINDIIGDIDLIINASVIGQSGIRKISDGSLTSLEPYNPLAEVREIGIEIQGDIVEGDFYDKWFWSARPGISENHVAALGTVRKNGARAAYFDLIYSPLETAFLRQARLSGHKVLNGKGMNIIQAVEAFVPRVLASYFEQRKYDTKAVYAKVFDAMLKVW
ncbi:MAG: hypothetical protein CL776_04985 [Chloroflexi bacterium]|nr:hypothetical protein [Chloroflexota bacterium]|tara:strand:+ start:2610 stop:3734 length:1125 start_codon:yes stop_codon:yes gene_type:complete